MVDFGKNILDYVDSMMIIDKNYNVLYSNRFNSLFSGSNLMNNEYLKYIKKKFFEVYPDLDSKESSMVEAIQQGKVVTRRNQTFADMFGRVYTTNNITLPIIRYAEVIGAIELSQDITSVGDRDNAVKTIAKGRTSAQSTSVNQFFTFDDIITNNPEMMENIRKAKIFALKDGPVLIYGETGTGKEMFVEAMVKSNAARNQNFIAQNCASIPENLFESILFGSVKGAFTGAENKKGLFEMADGGVLFLDEFNSMPLHLQAKLLRVLQDGRIRSIGSNVERGVDVKVIVAMNKNPIQLIKDNLLREDLFYRLSSSTLSLIALRDRPEDISLYISHFVRRFNEKYHKCVAKLSPDLKKQLQRYPWPGNVRELSHVIESMIQVSEKDVLTINNLPAYLKEMIDMDGGGERMDSLKQILQLKTSLKGALENVERDYIVRALEACNGNVSRAAELLDMPRQTLKFRMDRLKLENRR